jgi:hypothetical protein
MMIPDYGRGRRPTRDEIDQLLEFGRIRVRRVDMPDIAYLSHPLHDSYRRLYLSRHLPHEAAIYIELHECGHSLAGDADEPTMLHFAGPLPEAEEVADLFALTGIITHQDCEIADATLGAEYIEAVIRQRAPIDDRGWQVYRVKELAPKVMRMRKLVDEWLE